jgi:hypothetical protein
MASWQQALMDGRIDAHEIQAQAQRVADRLRELEPTLSDAQHAVLTDALSELTVLHAMQAGLAQARTRGNDRVYRCPNADLVSLSQAISDRFRRDGFEVEVASEMGSWVIRTKKSDGWRMAFGMVYDVTIRLVPLPDGFQVKLDWGQWTDKIISGVLTLVGAWPWLVTGSIGLYNEYELMKDAEEIIENYVAACAGGVAG